MRRPLIALTLLLLSINAAAKCAHSAQGAPENSAEREIRAALCEIDKGDLRAAQERLERVLQSAPENIYAQRLLPSVIERQIKVGDTSPENLAQVRRAMESYQRAARNPQFTDAERTDADKHLLDLYRWLGEEAQHNEILRRAADPKRMPKERSELYAALASQLRACAFDITSAPKAPTKGEIEKAKDCVTRGLDYVNQAIALNGDSTEAWLNKADLFKEAAALAGIENDQTKKTSYQRQFDEAEKYATDLEAKHDAESEKELARQNAEPRKDQSLKHLEEVAKDLTEYKAENSLDEAVNRAFVETDLKAAAQERAQDRAEQKTTTDSRSSRDGCFSGGDRSAAVWEKQEWKTFSTDDGDLIADLPDNVCRDGRGYLAASEGVLFNVLKTQAVALDSTVVNAVLNTMARTFAGWRGGTWVGNGSGHRFELKLLRKEDLNGQHRKSYAYALTSCSEMKEGVVIVHASKAFFYLIDISGANESDARVQRFLKSLKFSTPHSAARK